MFIRCLAGYPVSRLSGFHVFDLNSFFFCSTLAAPLLYPFTFCFFVRLIMRLSSWLFFEVFYVNEGMMSTAILKTDRQNRQIKVD
jgi:hypothetical protein